MNDSKSRLLSALVISYTLNNDNIKNDLRFYHIACIIQRKQL